MLEEDFATTASAWEAAGERPGCPEEGVSGEIAISGSSTVEPSLPAAAEGFSGSYPDVSISVDGPGTGTDLFCSGETDISDAPAPSRTEIAACEDGGTEFIELQIGLDGLSILTKADLSPQAPEGRAGGSDDPPPLSAVLLQFTFRSPAGQETPPSCHA